MVPRTPILRRIVSVLGSTRYRWVATPTQSPAGLAARGPGGGGKLIRPSRASDVELNLRSCRVDPRCAAKRAAPLTHTDPPARLVNAPPRTDLRHCVPSVRASRRTG